MNQQIWPGWNTVRVIGSGGFGKVYEIRKAEDSKTGEYRSALKVITIPQSPEDYHAYEDDGYDEKSITAIFRSQIDDIVSEFQMMSQFRGTSNIVSYEDHRIIPHADGRGWDILIRMELLTTLPEYFNRRGMSEADTVKLGQDICRALELCGQKDIIHRDIKPQNIFVNEFGDFKLGDFGIAKSMDHTTKATKIGTYNYMAPEVYQNKPYGASVDIYSLGLVMYWLLNERRLPFMPMPPAVPTAAQNNEAQMRRLSGGGAIPAPKNGSPALKAVVLRAIAFDPAERFSSPKEFLAALNSCGSTAEQVYAGTDSWGESTATENTWSKISGPRGRSTAPGKAPPDGESTRGIWNDTTSSAYWTQHDPFEEKPPEEPAFEEPAPEEDSKNKCPYCGGTGKRALVRNKFGGGWATRIKCLKCGGTGIRRGPAEVPKEFRTHTIVIGPGPKSLSVNPNCPCCSGVGKVEFKETDFFGWYSLSWHDCPQCGGYTVKFPHAVQKSKALALLIFFTIGWCTGAHCFYEGRYKVGLLYLACICMLATAMAPAFALAGVMFISEIIRVISRPWPSYWMIKGEVIYNSGAEILADQSILEKRK